MPPGHQAGTLVYNCRRQPDRYGDAPGCAGGGFQAAKGSRKRTSIVMTPLLFTEEFAAPPPGTLPPLGAWGCAGFGALFLAGYLLLDGISYIRPSQALNVTPWSLQSALAVTLLVICGQRWLPLVFLAALTAEILLHGLPVPFTGALALAATLAAGYAAIAYVLTRGLRMPPALHSGKDVLRLTLAVLAGTAATNLLYLGVLAAEGYIASGQFFEAYLRCWVGDSVGLLVTLPLLLMLADSGRRRQLGTIAGSGVTLLQLALVGATLWIVFARGQAEQFNLCYLLFLPLVWISTRHGLAGAVAAVTVLQAGIAVAAGVGNLGAIEAYELQALLMALCITGYSLGISVDERRHAVHRLTKSAWLSAAGEMATALAHELNQPLTALSAYACSIHALVESSGIRNQTLLDTADKIRRTAIRSADVVSRFRGQLATAEPNLRPGAMSKPARDAISSCKERADIAGIRLVLDVPDDIPPVRLDAARIEIVFRNLIGNALDSIERSAAQSGLVCVKIEFDGSPYVLATVTDSGSGVPGTRAEHVFEPFFSETPSGMGLGLALSRAIVESHGGKLWAESGDRGIFRFSLPL